MGLSLFDWVVILGDEFVEDGSDLDLHVKKLRFLLFKIAFQNFGLELGTGQELLALLTLQICNLTSDLNA